MEGNEAVPGLHAWLAASGIRREQVTHVLITHTHHDHYAGVARVDENGQHPLQFPRARHLMGRQDWEEDEERLQPDSELSLRLGAVERAGLLELVDSETEVAPGITLIPAPGETPGHCIVRVRSQGAGFYVSERPVPPCLRGGASRLGLPRSRSGRDAGLSGSTVRRSDDRGRYTRLCASSVPRMGPHPRHGFRLYLGKELLIHAAVLISCDAASAAFALDELRLMFDRLPHVTWLDEDLAFLEAFREFDVFSRELERRAPVFIRHIAPAQRRFALCGALTDLDVLRVEVRLVSDRLDPARSFAVQSRILGEGTLPYRRFTINQTLSDELQGLIGAPLDTRLPEQVVSVLCTPNSGYLGVSLASQNRSLWPGGAHRFRREGSRSAGRSSNCWKRSASSISPCPHREPLLTWGPRRVDGRECCASTA